MARFRKIILIAVALLPAFGLRAEEGMWMPQQIPQLAARLQALGFAGDPKAFADLTGQPMGAIVSLGGCTASFVSPDGLIVTNHHCVTGGLQFNSTPQRNLLRDGYLARTRDEELSNGPGSHVYVTTAVTEVTEAITGKIDPKATDRQRNDIIDRRIKERIAACEKEGMRCNVASFFEGLKYYEIAQLDIKDVRLVYAPAEGIGVFGGETDNWRWPRHTGDWSYLRAYVSKDGKAVPYAKDNVPYKPKHWLQVSTEGAKPGELVFVVGYPGRTQRHQTYAEVKETTEWAFPRSIRLAGEQLAVIDKLIAGNKDLAIKVANRIQSLNNNTTNQKGMLEGLVKGGALAQKQAMEKELEAWIAADPARQKKYGDVLPALRALQAEERKNPRTKRGPGKPGVGILLPERCADPVPPFDPAPQKRSRPRIRISGTRLGPHPRKPGPPAAHDRRHRRSRFPQVGHGIGSSAPGRPEDRTAGQGRGSERRNGKSQMPTAP